MLHITLKGGDVREVAENTTAEELCRDISMGLFRAACAVRIDGAVCDLRTPLTRDCAVEFLTFEDEDGRKAFRHTASHILAQAVLHLFPGVKFAIGPAIDNGFYYDFDREEAFSADDLEKIEAEMARIAKEALPIERFELPIGEARALMADQPYKLELMEEHADKGEAISFYRQGDFTDLCAGPHLMTTAPVKAVKLTACTGAYWRGSEKNKMLSRIYGTAFPKKAELDAYLAQLEEAKKRDHRRLGKELDLFHLQEEAPGLIFWHAKGWTLWQVVEQFMRRIYRENGYQEVKAPQLLDRSLWERSGHWAKYRSNMFTTESENRYYALKPMNCPGHIQLFNAGLRSYRDLPLRYGEFGQCHRNEPSGALHGLMRVRGFTQDDGHIFCTEDQILKECMDFTRIVRDVYHTFGFEDILYKVATRPEMRIGEDAVWDKAEAALIESLDACGLPYEILPGEGAFYGPKIEYHLKDCLGRTWQCGTIQVDFQMPGRLGAEYVAEDNSRKVPVMLHRAILGSLERWIGMLIEHYAGAMPVWLSPVQVAVASITDAQSEFAADVARKMREAGIRVIEDLRSQKINYKIRELTLQKLPYIAVVGDKEAQSGTVSVRARGGKNLGVMPIEEFIARVVSEDQSRKNTDD